MPNKFYLSSDFFLHVNGVWNPVVSEGLCTLKSKVPPIRGVRFAFFAEFTPCKSCFSPTFLFEMFQLELLISNINLALILFELSFCLPLLESICCEMISAISFCFFSFESRAANRRASSRFVSIFGPIPLNALRLLLQTVGFDRFCSAKSDSVPRCDIVDWSFVLAKSTLSLALLNSE